jgi:hypothetical protein
MSEWVEEWGVIYLLNDMIAILILDAFEDTTVEFTHKLGLLLGQDMFQSL